METQTSRIISFGVCVPSVYQLLPALYGTLYLLCHPIKNSIGCIFSVQSLVCLHPLFQIRSPAPPTSATHIQDGLASLTFLCSPSSEGGRVMLHHHLKECVDMQTILFLQFVGALLWTKGKNFAK